MLFRFCGKRKLQLAIAATILLFVISEVIVILRPTWGYYFTAARAFELAIGATLALAPNWSRITARQADILAFAGLAAIVAGFVVLTERSHSPGFGALLPCLGIAAMLLAGTHHETLVGRAISNRPMRYIGDISYSFYLWHWPPLEFMRYYYGLDLAGTTLVACLAVSFLLSVVSYHFVEIPFLNRKGRDLPYLRLGSAMACLVGAVGVYIALLHGMPERLKPNIRAILAAQDDFSPKRNSCHVSFEHSFVYQDSCVLGTPGVSEPLPNRRLQYTHRTVAVFLVARIPTTVEFRQIPTKVLFRDVVERTNNPALQQAVVAFGKVGVEN